MSKPQIAFIGLGAMGSHMAKTLIAAGYPLKGYDIRPEAVEALHGNDKSLSPKTSSEAAKGASVIVLMTISHVQAHSILFHDGALDVLAPNAVILLMATCSKEACSELAQQVKKKRSDIGFVDAPVSGGSEGAKTGGLTIMAAAKQDVFSRVEDVLLTMGSKLYHVGQEVGQGSAMKAVNQVLCGIHLAAAAEALSLAKAAGIDPEVALPIVQNSAASSWMLQNRAPRMIQSEDPEVKSAVNLFVKDLDIVGQTGKQVGAALPISASAMQMFVSAAARGDGMKDDSRVIKSYWALNGKE